LTVFIGGGKILEQDVVRQAYSLLINTDEATASELKESFDDKNTNNLFEKLINHVTIIKTILFVISDEEENKARGKNSSLIKFKSSILNIFRIFRD
jgi:hypothetical protein